MDSRDSDNPGQGLGGPPRQLIPSPPPPQQAELEGEARPCDVCVLLKKDMAEKQVTWCKLCQSWICGDCYNRWDWRTIAAFKKGLSWAAQATRLTRNPE